tara:strand:- start:165 stop:860 length:696 start_codon:yes stop_codon:yes gene_type:complete
MATPELYKKSFLEFLADLEKVCPEHEGIKRILKMKEKFKYEKHQKYYLSKLQGNEKKLLAKDESIFNEECVLIPTIDFSILWKKIPDEDKNAVWMHMQSLYLISQKIEKPADDVTELITKMKLDNNTVNENMSNKMQNIMSQNNPLVNLAKSITEDIMKGPIGKMSQEELLQSLMKGKDSELLKHVQSKIDTEVQDGKLDLSEMESSAKSMLSEIEGIMPDNIQNLVKQQK